MRTQIDIFIYSKENHTSFTDIKALRNEMAITFWNCVVISFLFGPMYS